MKTLVICNNYNLNYDGIGKYASSVYQNFVNLGDVVVFSAKMRGDDKIFNRILSFDMSKTVISAVLFVIKNNIDIVIIEYPFVELNPLTICLIYILKLFCISRGIKFVLSLHEYDRVNFIRKIYIKLLLLISDVCFVTENRLITKLIKYCKKIFIRNIPATIPKKEKNKRTGFAYFGLINKSKMIYPMITAFELNKIKLKFLTASVVPNEIINDKTVEVYVNLCDEKVAEVLASSICCVLPILPEVDQKNSSFAAAVRNGCICIGKFCNEYKDLPFVVHISKYTVEEFEKAIKYVDKLPPCVIHEKTKLAYEFGKKYSAECVYEMMLREINKN